MTETSISVLGKKNSENAVFVGSRFPALGGGSLDKIFFERKIDSFLYPKKIQKLTHFDG